MPKVAMDFSKTVIYHFVCKDANIKCEYVGSTTNFNQLKGRHKIVCQNEASKNYHLKLYQTIREYGGWNNWKMIPLEEFPCENYNQQLIREQYWIERLKPEMNCRVAHRKGNEYEKQKAWRDENKEVISEKSKAYREANKEVIKERKSAFYQDNKEVISEKQKAWRDENKEVIKERKSVKFTCNCGSICRINDKAKHERSMKHQAFIAPTAVIVE